VPYEAFKIRRAGGAVDSREPIQPCDVIVFDVMQRQVRRIVVTTMFSGRNITVDTDAPEATIGCDGDKPRKPSLSTAAMRLWRDAISSGDRYAVPQDRTAATKGAAAATRSEAKAVLPVRIALDLPIFSSERSLLVAGKRSLVVVWVGNAPSYHVKLARADSGEVLAEATNVRGNRVDLPPVTLSPGQLSLTVIDSEGNGVRQDQLFVVTEDRAPPMPAQIGQARLDAAEKTLIYVYYLEGLEDGRWMFEALQQAAGISPATQAVSEWLSMFSSPSLQ